MKHTQHSTSEKGQSLLIISLGMVVLIAFIAVVVDAGYNYVQRRQLQNSMDAAAQAGTLKVAVAGSTNANVNSAVTNFASTNGTDPSRINAYYVVQDNSGNNIVVRTLRVDQYTQSSAVPKTLSVSGTSYPVVGVQVEADRTFNTFFAGVLGFPQLQVHGASAAYANKCANSSTELFPLALNVATFPDENGDGIRDVHYEQTEPSYYYTLHEKSAGQQTAGTQFGWVTWTAGDVGATTLTNNINDPRNSGLRSVGDSIYASTTTMDQVQSAIQVYINTGRNATIPIFDTVTGTGSAAQFHIIGFARIHITGMNTAVTPRTLTAKFEEWVDPQSDGGAPCFGIASVHTHPPLDVTRSLVGTIKIPRYHFTPGTTITTHVPVDVINVLDISGSMNDPFGATSKISAARTAMTNFNNQMKPAQGDQVALVTFPTTQATSSYSYGGQTGCDAGTNSYLWIAQDRNSLTSNVASVNSTISGLTASGWTPIASGLQHGRSLVLGANHVASHRAVLILASDGLANVLINGHLTGFPGLTYSSPACNAGAVQDAVNQANIAKSDANNDGQPDVIIYTIAIGDNFNPSLLQAIASPDTDPSRPHYFRATDAASMQAIYNQIANEVQTIYAECTTTPTEGFAPYANVSIRFPDGTTQNVQTTSTGEFVLTAIPSGGYQITSASVTVDGLTYNVPTDGVGGPAISFPINVTVGDGSGTYTTDFALKPSSNVSCNSH